MYVIQKGYPYKTKPSTGNHLFYFCLKTPKYHKQCVITTDAEYVSSQVSSKNTYHKIHFPDAAHQQAFHHHHHHHHLFFFSINPVIDMYHKDVEMVT